MDRDSREADEGARAIDWLNEKWTSPRECPICGAANWEVSQVAEMRSFAGGSVVLGGGGVVPVFPAVCSSCGFIHLFSAVKSGVVRIEEYSEEGVAP